MRAIGSRALKAHLGEVLRKVRDEGETYLITHRGRPIAELVPCSIDMTSGESDVDFETAWAEMDRLAAELSKSWSPGVSAAEAVSQDRRTL